MVGEIGLMIADHDPRSRATRRMVTVQPAEGDHNDKKRVIAKKNEVLPATTQRCHMGVLNGRRSQR